MLTEEWECVCVSTDTQTMLGYSSLEGRRHSHVLIWGNRREGRRTGGRADPTSTEAAEAAARDLRNNYLTFRDRRGGVSLELKRSKEQLSYIPSLPRVASGFRVSRMEPVFSFSNIFVFVTCLHVHICMCVVDTHRNWDPRWLVFREVGNQLQVPYLVKSKLVTVPVAKL